MVKRVTTTTTSTTPPLPHHLSAAQKDVLHLWPVVNLCRSKNGTVKVVQKTTDETPIVPQRLRNHSISGSNNAAEQKKEVAQLRAERTKCNYSLRSWAFSTYMDSDVLYSHDATYCQQCQAHYFGVCSLHFKLVLNREVVRDGGVEERARLTAPWPLYVAESKIPGAGEGVWTSAALPRGLVFGPYEGQILRVKRNSKAANSGYAWHLQLKSPRKIAVYIDSVNKSISNWLRYVNCARDAAEMNLEAFQFKDNVYYITLRKIESNTELLVWYGDEYGRELGILGLSNNNLSMTSAQEEPTEKLHKEGTELSSESHPSCNEQVQHKLSKPQVALQHLFCPATLEAKENHSVRVVYVNADRDKDDEESSEGGSRKHTISGNEPCPHPSVRFNQKYNCKYNHAYCVKCRKTYSGLCPKHPMTLILDKPVPRDGSVQNRAELTVPWPLYIAKSKVEDAGQGVWTSASLPAGLVFGPCEGHVIRKTGRVSGYGWEIQGKPDIEVDAEDTSMSNWVRYINCARNYIERNLIAMQIQNEIFYVTNTKIERDTELMVWYGAAYGNWLGISTSNFFRPRLKETELERWCSDCQVLFTSPEFLSKHQERCGQNVRGKSRKRTLQDLDFISCKHMKKEERPQRKDRVPCTVRTCGDHLFLEVEDAVSQTRDASDVSGAGDDYSASGPSSASRQPFHVSSSTRISENNVSQKVWRKPECSQDCGHKAFCSSQALKWGRWPVAPHGKSNVGKFAFKKVPCSFHKGSTGCISHDRSVLPNAKSLMCFGHKPNSHHNVLGSHGLPKATKNSKPTQDSSGTSPKSSQFNSVEIMDSVSMNSSSVQLDSFLNCSVHFSDSLNQSHLSHSSDTAVQDESAGHTSGYVSIASNSHSSNCGNESINVFDSCQCSPHTPAHRPHVSCRDSTDIGKLCGEEEENEKSQQICNSSSNNIDFLCTQKNFHSTQSNEGGRKCSASDGMRGTDFEKRVDADQKVLSHSRTGNCYPHGPDGALQRTLESKDLINTLQMYWKRRQDVHCRWQTSSHATIQQFQIYVQKKYKHDKEMACRGKAAFHPQETVVAQAKHCIHEESGNTSPNSGLRARNIGVYCNSFYGPRMGSKRHHQNVKMSRKCWRQVPSIRHHSDPTHHGGNNGMKRHNHSAVSGSGQSNALRRRDSCARKQPLQPLDKKQQHLYSNLCLRNSNGTLYECFMCGRKFASKYNFHEHQYFCT